MWVFSELGEYKNPYLGPLDKGKGLAEQERRVLRVDTVLKGWFRQHRGTIDTSMRQFKRQYRTQE